MVHWDAPDAFVEFVRDRHAALLRFAYALSGSASLAEDLVQDALERTGVSWRKVRSANPEGYVRRTIVNRYLNRIRSVKREVLVDSTIERPSEYADPEHSEIWELLKLLPRRQRAVIVLRFYLDLSEKEIADMLGCSVGTVKSNSSRAVSKLGNLMNAANEQQVAS